MIHRVTIGCEAEGSPGQGQTAAARVEIEFGEAKDDHVCARTRLSLPGQAFEDRRTYYGFDILAFADGLMRVHAELSGSARLYDCDGEPVLCLTAIDARRGRIAIGGQLIPAVFWAQTRTEDGLLAPRLFGDAGGVRVAFEGLTTDQSYLSPVIAGLRRVLGETGISTRNPMEQGGPGRA